MAQPRTDRSRSTEPAWQRRLRDAIGGSLLDVRTRQEGDAVDFLLVHRSGGRRAAICAFSDALVEAGEVPPFDIRTADESAAGADEYRRYVSLRPA